MLRLLLTVIFDEPVNVERDELEKAAALKLILAATPKRAPEKVAVLFCVVRVKLTATLSLLKLAL